MRRWLTTFYLKNALVILIVLVPFMSWTYHTFYFDRYITHAVRKTVQIVDIATIPYHIAKLSSQPPDKKLRMPVAGVSVSEVEDSWGQPRDGGVRSHQGIDIFAKRGTPIYAAASGFVVRTGVYGIGGNHVYVMGAGGRRYYYAHLDRFGGGIKLGAEVTTDTIIGYVGNTGNAINTPAHLHFGMYLPNQGARNPYNLFVDRNQILVLNTEE